MFLTGMPLLIGFDAKSAYPVPPSSLTASQIMQAPIYISHNTGPVLRQSRKNRTPFAKLPNATDVLRKCNAPALRPAAPEELRGLLESSPFFGCKGRLPAAY